MGNIDADSWASLAKALLTVPAPVSLLVVKETSREFMTEGRREGLWIVWESVLRLNWVFGCLGF